MENRLEYLKAWQRANPEKVRGYKRTYLERHPEQVEKNRIRSRIRMVEYYRKMREERPEEYGRFKESNRKRGRETKDKYYSSHREERISGALRWQKENPDKRKAHVRLRYAELRGKTERPKGCSRCGVIGRVDAHHEDYGKPIDVVWLCRICHKAVHADLPPLPSLP